MKIETKKNYDVKITHEERRVIMNALVYAEEHGMDKTQCVKLLDEFINHDAEE